MSIITRAYLDKDRKEYILNQSRNLSAASTENYGMLKSSCCYQVDAKDNIISIDGAWSAFARENGGQSLLNNPPLGRSIWDFINGLSTRNIYFILMKRVRENGRSVHFPFRCDSPDKLRYMEMTIRPGQSGSLWFETAIAKEIPIEQNQAPKNDAHGTRELINMCAWCDRVQVGSEWLPLEVGIWSLALFDTPEAPPITHDICPDCYEELHQSLQKRQSILGNQNLQAKI